MGVFQEDTEGPSPTRAELIHLVNIWLDLEQSINREVGPSSTDIRGTFERGRAAGMSIAIQDLLELLGLYSGTDTHDEATFAY